MGVCASMENEDDDDSKRNRKIDEFMEDERMNEKKEIKVLLLGSGESGKSTIFKQMKILHKNGFSTEERVYYRELVRQNTVEAIQALTNACRKFEIAFGSYAILHAAERISALQIYENIPLKCKQDVQLLWKDRGVRMAYRRSNEFHLIDSTQYFMENIDRTFREGYIPTDQDILRTRIPTTGIVKLDFKLDKLTFRLFDVGGQRGERKKWIHCFDGVTAILFIASLSEYDQTLIENPNRNRMKESLYLFEGIINLPWFKDTPVILFLNKDDLFKKKVKNVDIGIYFPQYHGGYDYDSGLHFIQQQYYKKNKNANKTIYCHITDATNTKNIKFVWRATKHMILEQNLLLSGLLIQ